MPAPARRGRTPRTRVSRCKTAFFGTRWGEPAGFAFGIFGGFYNMWKLTKKAQAALEREDRIAGRKPPKDLGNEKEP